jgi:predicted permease
MLSLILELANESRLIIRRARKERAFVLTVVATLAVCIGVNCAIFTVIHSVVLQPLPLPESERIVAFADQYPGSDPNFSWLNNARSYFERPDAVPAVANQTFFRPQNRAIRIADQAEQIRGLEVTPEFFSLIRTGVALGRPFVIEDMELGKEAQIILSFDFWQRVYAGDITAIGRSIDVDSRPFLIVGVMPSGFSFFDPDVRFWVPIAFTTEQKVESAATRLTYGWYHMGRLAPGVDLAQAQAQVDALNAANLERFPDLRSLLVNLRFHTLVVPLQETLVRDIRETLYLLWAGAGLVLLIGAMNIASVTIARVNGRARELATRFAIGADGRAITRLLVLENAMLAACGGAAGVLVAYAVLYALRIHELEAIPSAQRIQISWVVLVYALTSALVVGTLVGFASARTASATNLNSALGSDAKSGTSGKHSRKLWAGLVVAQIGLSMMLLVGTALLLTTFRNLLSTDPGFASGRVVTASISLPVERYAGDVEVRDFTERFLRAIRAIPGVERAGTTTNIPMGTIGGWGPIIGELYDPTPGESVVSPWRIVTSPGYLEAMGMTVVRGEGFSDNVRADSERVMLVDEALARRFWGDDNPIGTRMYRPRFPNDLNRTDENTQFYTVVGVVRQVQLRDLTGKGGRSFGAFYLPSTQWPSREFVVAIKTSITPESVLRTVRAELAVLDPALPLFDVRTMTERVDLSLATRRLAVELAGIFGAVALLLAGVGIYGVLSYILAQRRREIAIRIALGSSKQSVFRLIVGEGTRLTALGLLLGMAGALLLSESLRSQLFEIAPRNPFILGSVALGVGVMALVVTVLPARKATQIDPSVALRGD